MKIRTFVIASLVASVASQAMAHEEHHEEVRREVRQERRDENNAVAAGAAAGLLVGVLAVSAAQANSAPDTEVVGDASTGTRLEAESQTYLDGVEFQKQPGNENFQPVVGPELAKTAQEQGVASEQDMADLASSIAQPQ